MHSRFSKCLLIAHLQNPPGLRKPCLHSHHEETQDAKIPSTQPKSQSQPPDDISRRSLINLQKFRILNHPSESYHQGSVALPHLFDYVLGARSVDTLIATGTLPPPFRTWVEFGRGGCFEFFWFPFLFFFWRSFIFHFKPSFSCKDDAYQ